MLYEVITSLASVSHPASPGSSTTCSDARHDPSLMATKTTSFPRRTVLTQPLIQTPGTAEAEARASTIRVRPGGLKSTFICLRLYSKCCRQAAPAKQREGAPRITSYNVCYTKLLRSTVAPYFSGSGS